MYADLLFLTEFLCDYLILLIVRQWAGYKTAMSRLALAGLAGAVLSTFLAIYYYNLPLFLNFIIGVSLCFVMIKIAFRPTTRSSYLYLVSYCYAVSLIQSGIINFVKNRYPSFSVLFLFIMGFFILKTVMFFKKIINGNDSKLCRVKIITDRESKYYIALIDTGNMLFDTDSKLPVSIIYENDLPEKDITKVSKKITFNSLGCTNGELEIIYVPYICIEYKGKKKLIQNAPLGLSAHKLSASDSYQMIISPEIIK